jgi:hypothetical protein
MFGPVCPVERIPPDPMCAPRPGASSVEADRADGTVAAQTQAGSDGQFALAVAQGQYTLRAHAETGASIGRGCEPIEVTVEAGAKTRVTVSCDTGIRN